MVFRSRTASLVGWSAGSELLPMVISAGAGFHCMSLFAVLRGKGETQVVTYSLQNTRYTILKRRLEHEGMSRFGSSVLRVANKLGPVSTEEAISTWCGYTVIKGRRGSAAARPAHGPG